MSPVASASGSIAKLEQILALSPSTALKFKDPYTDEVTTNLKLQNPSDRKVCFKVKTTVPHQYCMWPNCGIIDPGFTVTAMDSKSRCVFEMLSENDNMNDKELSKTVLLNASKQDGLTSKPCRVSFNDTETRKLMEECNFSMKLMEETSGRNGKDLRLKDATHLDKPGSASTASFRDNVTSPLSSLLVITAIFIRFLNSSCRMKHAKCYFFYFLLIRKRSAYYHFTGSRAHSDHFYAYV